LAAHVITLYPCLLIFGSGFFGVTAGNLIGGLIFFWVDKYIFINKIVPTYWEIKEKEVCFDCGKIGRGFRVVKAKDYNKINDKNPEYRCDDCSKKKLEELKFRGVEVACD
jgi:hypothetical protein